MVSLTWKVRGAVALLLGGIALVVALFFWNARRMASAAALVEHTRAVQAAVEAVLSRTYIIESSTRGYVATGNPEFLGPATAARGEMRARLDELARLVADNPEQAAHLDPLRADVEEKITFNFAVAALTRAGDVEGARARIATGEGKRLSDSIAARLAAMNATSATLLHARLADLGDSHRRTTVVGGTLILVLALAGVILWLFLRHQARERARADAAVRAAEERLRLLVASVREYAIITLDKDGRVASWNPGAERIHGYRESEILGRHFSVFFEPHEIAAGAPEAELRAAAGEGNFERDSIRLRKDGGRVWAHVVVTPIRGADGRLAGYAKVTQDISERKRTEEERQQLIERLQRSNTELQDFAMVASHDLQEPLRKIQMFGERLNEQYGAVLDERGRDYLTRMRSAAERGRVLIQGLLAYSRVTTKAQPPVPVDLEQVTREVVSDLEARIASAGGRVQVDTPLPTIDADPLQIRQLLQNLIGNALKFHKDDQPPVVTVRARHSGGNNGESTWGIEISDNGIGFDQKYADKIFKLFQRLHDRGAYEGAGMGLAICRKIVERHHGTITARSTPGEGATFVIELPTHQPKEVAA